MRCAVYSDGFRYKSPPRASLRIECSSAPRVSIHPRLPRITGRPVRGVPRLAWGKSRHGGVSVRCVRAHPHGLSCTCGAPSSHKPFLLLFLQEG